MNWLKNLKLSLTEWAAVSAALAIGGLVAALKIQGRRLHKAQLDLLGVRLDARSEKARADTADALAAYDKAKQDYLNKGGKL